MRESVAARAGVDPDCEAAGVLRSVWDLAAAEGRAHAALLRECLRVLEVIPQGPDVGGESWCVEEAEYAIAQAMRCTIGGAGYVLEDARRAVQHFPQTMTLLESGELPLRWHRRMLRHSTGLTEDSCQVLDGIVAGWDLRIGEDAFRRRLALEVRRLRDLEEAAQEAPVPERSVMVGAANTDDGSACLMVQGPAPEILALGHRLDAAARAVRSAQREALAAGEVVPFDDGSVAETGQVLSLGRLRYEVLTRSMLDTGGIEVPTERFRLTVTVPALTLLGRSEAPGLLEGTVPLPAAMARELAGSEETWYRILTDPVTGAFLPLPARRYAPSVSMLEHLRTRNPVCAVPGCGRGVRHGAEADHIVPFDHDHPEHGGPTEVENLHLLCRRHHQMKTAGILRPTRDTNSTTTTATTQSGDPWAAGERPRRAATGTDSGESTGTGTGTEPGRTVWTFHPDPTGPAVHTITHRDEHDLMTPATVHDLTRVTHGPEAANSPEAPAAPDPDPALDPVPDPDPPPRAPTAGTRLPTRSTPLRSTTPPDEPVAPALVPSAFADPPPF